MSISKRKNRSFYPSKLKVDSIFNEKTKEYEDVIIGTGPYRKEICGETKKEIEKYLVHLVELYNNNKANHLKTASRKAS